MATLHSLNFKTVIEGVETEEQANLAREVKGTYQQGYLYSRPLCMEDFANFINA